VQGSVFRRCGCRDADGRRLNKRCPKLARQKHGQWYARYDEPRAGDERRRQPMLGPFSTKDEAAARLGETIGKIYGGSYQPTDGTLTIGVDFDRWLDTRVGLARTTFRQTKEIGALYLKPGLGYLRLRDVRQHHVEDLYAAMRLIGRPTGEGPDAMLRRLLDARGSGPQSHRRLSRARIRRVHAVVRAYFNSAIRRGLIQANPAAHVELEASRPVKPLAWSPERVARWRVTGRRPSPVMVWTPEQAGAFLDAATTDRLYPLFHLVAYRGLRRGEALGLPWTDIDLDTGNALVRETYLDPDVLGPDFDTFDDTKTEHSERVISLDAQTVAVLRRWRTQQTAERHTWGKAWVDSGRLFTKENGEPLNPDTVSQRFGRLIERTGRITVNCAAITRAGTPCQRQAVVTVNDSPRCGLSSHGRQDPAALPLRHPEALPPIRFHDLRHTAASLTYRATRDLKLVSELVGHSSIEFTSDTYTTLFGDVDRAAAEAVADLVPRRTA
jgi:integrase